MEFPNLAKAKKKIPAITPGFRNAANNENNDLNDPNDLTI
jgi:hypothetical protein